VTSGSSPQLGEYGRLYIRANRRGDQQTSDVVAVDDRAVDAPSVEEQRSR